MQNQTAHSKPNHAGKRIHAFRNGQSMVHFFGIDPKDPTTHWNFNRKDADSFNQIVRALPAGVDILLMPQPTSANAKIINPIQLRCRFKVNNVAIFGGAKADGCVMKSNLRSRTAVAFASADCATIVAHSKNDKVVIVAHAGRDSVIDRGIIEDDLPRRHNFGIVDTILDEMRAHGYRAHEVFFGVYGGIRKNFIHPPENTTYGRYNRGLIEYCRPIKGTLLDELTGEVDMYRIIRDRAYRKGTPKENFFFDNVDTGSDTENGVPIWASHRHGVHGTRNLIVVHPIWK